MSDDNSYSIYNNTTDRYLRAYKDDGKVILNWNDGAIIGLALRSIITTLKDMKVTDVNDIYYVPYNNQDPTFVGAKPVAELRLHSVKVNGE